MNGLERPCKRLLKKISKMMKKCFNGPECKFLRNGECIFSHDANYEDDEEKHKERTRKDENESQDFLDQEKRNNKRKKREYGGTTKNGNYWMETFY